MEEKVVVRINVNPGLALTSFRTILPRKTRQTWSAVHLKKHVTSTSCRLEPAIWSRDTGQQIPCFDKCQLIITWMSNIKKNHSKPKLHGSVNLLFGVWPPFFATLSSPLCVRIYARTSNASSHDNREKINSWVFFSFLYGYGAPLGGPLELRYEAKGPIPLGESGVIPTPVTRDGLSERGTTHSLTFRPYRYQYNA